MDFTNKITNPAFREGIMEALGFQVDDLSLEAKGRIIRDVEENWWFCGGRDTQPESETPCPYNTKEWATLWRHYHGNKPMPDACRFCVCRQDGLRYNLFITDGPRVITIGSVCMYQFLPRIAGQIKSKYCEHIIGGKRCMEPHRNRKDNYCKECRPMVKEEREAEEERKKQEEKQEREREEQMEWRERMERERERREEREREEEKERERRVRQCECGMVKAPYLPQCYHCHQKKLRQRQEELNQMTPQQRKAIQCACGKLKKPQFLTCWGCKK